jgi:hypothetical protein
MTGLQQVFVEAVRNNKAYASRYFYEVHHRLIRRYSEAYGVPFLNACVAFARLSPRTSVSLNLRAFVLILDGKPKPNGVLTANWQSAIDALSLSEAQLHTYLYCEPLTKVRAFARNLLLDTGVITIDAIMMRILKDYYSIPSLNHLFSNYAEWHTTILPAIQELDHTMVPYQIQSILWDYARRLYAPIPKAPKPRIFDSAKPTLLEV